MSNILKVQFDGKLWTLRWNDHLYAVKTYGDKTRAIVHATVLAIREDGELRVYDATGHLECQGHPSALAARKGDK